MGKIEPGCWIETRFGRAVCVEVIEGCQIEGEFGQKVEIDSWVSFRYRATRCSDKKEIWVFNGEPLGAVRFRGKPTRFTARILTLTGPYGEG